MPERAKSPDARSAQQGSTETPAPAPDRSPEASSGEGNQPETQELLFTLDATTGEVLKIERLDARGGRTELTADENAAIAAALVSQAYAPQAYAPQAYAPQAYDMQALPQPYATSYEAYGLAPEALAYYQGMHDYATAVAAASGVSLEELAYYQGMADYAAALQ